MATIVGKARVMKYEDILEAQRLRERKELKKQVTPGHPKKEQLQPSQSAKRNEDIEKERALREIVSSGLKAYCDVIEL
jgi:hypothetical protein